MRTHNVTLNEDLEGFITAEIESGRYGSASEVVQAALRSLERDEREHNVRLASLRKAIDEGDASGLAEEGVFARVRESLGLTR